MYSSLLTFLPLLVFLASLTRAAPMLQKQQQQHTLIVPTASTNNEPERVFPLDTLVSDEKNWIEVTDTSLSGDCYFRCPKLQGELLIAVSPDTGLGLSEFACHYSSGPCFFSSETGESLVDQFRVTHCPRKAKGAFCF